MISLIQVSHFWPIWASSYYRYYPSKFIIFYSKDETSPNFRIFQMKDTLCSQKCWKPHVKITTGTKFICIKNTREDTQEMPQSRSTACLRHHKEGWGTTEDKTNAKYESTDAQTKKNCNGGNPLQMVSGKTTCGGGDGGGGLNQFLCPRHFQWGSI